MPIDMNLFNEAWKGAQLPSEGTLGDVADGRYRCELLEHRVKTVKEGRENAGAPLIALAFRIIDGDYTGRWIWKNLLLVREAEAMGYVRQDLKTLGADVEEPGEGALEAALTAAVGNTVMVRLATKGGQQHAYINKDTSA